MTDAPPAPAAPPTDASPAEPGGRQGDQGDDGGWLSPAALLTRLPVGLAVTAVVPMAAAGLAQQLGAWTPAVGFAALAAGAVLGVLAARVVPPARAGARTAGAILLVALGVGTWAGATHGEHVVVTRDAGAYATYALTLDAFGGVPLDPQLEVFGLTATDPQAEVGALANYQVLVEEGGEPRLEIRPQFLVGAPALFSLGWWAGGWSGLFLVAPVLAAAGVLAFGALTAHVVGPRAAVVASLALAVSQPLVLVARQTYSEPASFFLLMTAALLATLALDSARTSRARWLGLLAGAVVGANVFVRVDGFRELALVLAVAVVLGGLRRPAGWPMLAGAVLTGLPAALATAWWASPYLERISHSLVPLLLGGAALLAVTTVIVALGRLLAGRRSPAPAPGALSRVLPVTAGLVVLATGLVLASRPLWLVDRWSYSRGFIESLQVAAGQPADGSRMYAEATVEWLSWWVGWPVLLVALGAASVLAARATRHLLAGEVPGWVVPFAVGFAVTVLVLYRPAVVPDHPWADRRFVAVAVPWVLLVATAGLAWVVRRARREGAAVGGAAAAIAVLALLLPASITTAPVAGARTELGQPAAAEQLCDAFGADAAVIAVGYRARAQWAPVLRARCQVPYVALVEREGAGAAGLADDVAEAAAAARANGREPVVFAGDEASLAALGLPARQVVDLQTTQPQTRLYGPADGTQQLEVDGWLATP